MYVPMLWFTQEVNLTSEYASQVKLLVIMPPLISGICFSVGALGILLAIMSVVIYIRTSREDGQTENLIPKEAREGDKDAEVTAINNEE